MIALLAADGSTDVNLWSERWFQGSFGASAFLALLGLYIAASAYLPLPMLPTLEERRVVAVPEVASPEPVEQEADREDAFTRPIFDRAPPELVDLSAASLGEILAGRTSAQASKIMEHHVGKSVRVSGVVDRVQFGTSVPSVYLKKGLVDLLLFFDRADDYDPEPILLALNKGDRIVAEAKIHSFGDGIVSVDHSRLIETRGRPA